MQRCIVQDGESVLNISYTPLCVAGETQLTSEGPFWSVMTLTFRPVPHQKWVFEKVKRAMDLIDFLFPGTPGWAHLTSVHGCDSLWTPSAYPWPLLGKCQGWAELLEAKKEKKKRTYSILFRFQLMLFKILTGREKQSEISDSLFRVLLKSPWSF